jgi:hypothetical protein
MLKSCGPGPFYRRRQYVGKYLVGIGVAAALMALSVGWLVSDAAAQTNDPPDNGALSVEECLGKDNASVGPTGQTLAREGVIEENLLSTLVTDDMCGDILKRTQNGDPVQALVAAQNYIQEIKLIEDSIHKAAGEATARASDRRLYGDVSLVSATVGLQANKGPAQRQYHDRETPSGDGSNGPRVKPIRRQAANVSETAAGVVADGDGSIADMFKRVEAVALSKGLSRSEADYSARCGLETAMLNAVSKELIHGRYIKVIPAPTPQEMEYGDTVTVELLVSGDVSGLYEKLEGQYGEVAEASGTEEGCVGVVESMKARLSDRSFKIDPHQDKEEKRITHDTAWRWDVTANTEGKNFVDLFVGHVLQLGEMELVPHWVEPSPVRHATITVKQEPLRARLDLVGRNWRWLLPAGIALAAATTWLVWMLRRREHGR